MEGFNLAKFQEIFRLNDSSSEYRKKTPPSDNPYQSSRAPTNYDRPQVSYNFNNQQPRLSNYGVDAYNITPSYEQATKYSSNFENRSDIIKSKRVRMATPKIRHN